MWSRSSARSEYLTLNQGVGGSNPPGAILVKLKRSSFLISIMRKLKGLRSLIASLAIALPSCSLNHLTNYSIEVVEDTRVYSQVFLERLNNKVEEKNENFSYDEEERERQVQKLLINSGGQVLIKNGLESIELDNIQLNINYQLTNQNNNYNTKLNVSPNFNKILGLKANLKIENLNPIVEDFKIDEANVGITTQSEAYFSLEKRIAKDVSFGVELKTDEKSRGASTYFRLKY